MKILVALKRVADPDNANHAYIAFSGFRQGDDAANVWETKDGGASWSRVKMGVEPGNSFSA